MDASVISVATTTAAVFCKCSMSYFFDANNQALLRRLRQCRQIRLYSSSPSPPFSIVINRNKGKERERQRKRKRKERTEQTTVKSLF